MIEKSGLVPAQPPDEIHAMSRGALASGGSAGYADLVVSGLAGAGKRLEPGERVLDFGCSSGRVVRVLAAAFPDVRWHACDPNEAAVAWAQANLPGIEFAVSAQEPPLPYADRVFLGRVRGLRSGPTSTSRWVCAGSRRCTGSPAPEARCC